MTAMTECLYQIRSSKWLNSLEKKKCLSKSDDVSEKSNYLKWLPGKRGGNIVFKTETNILCFTALTHTLNVPLIWPTGTFSLYQPVSGCPHSHTWFSSGWITQVTEDTTMATSYSSGHHFFGKYCYLYFSTCQRCVRTETIEELYDKKWIPNIIAKFKYHTLLICNKQYYWVNY